MTPYSARMENLIAHLFLARELAHREHLRVSGVGSDARHRALNQFYDAIVEAADEIAEAYQGRFGLMGEIPMLLNSTSGTIVDVLSAHVEWIAANRYTACPQSETAIQNLIDEAVAAYYKALYRLKNLA